MLECAMCPPHRRPFVWLESWRIQPESRTRCAFRALAALSSHRRVQSAFSCHPASTRQAPARRRNQRSWLTAVFAPGSSRSGSRGADVRPHSSAAPRRLVRERPAAMGATDARSRSRARLSVGALTPTARSAGHRRSDRAQALSPGPGRRGAVLNGGQHSRRRVHGRHRHHRDGLGAHLGPLEAHGAASLQGFPVSSWRGV